MMIPLELVTMIGSGLLSGVLTLWSKAIEGKKAHLNRLVDALDASDKSAAAARSILSGGFAWTRRVIALSAVAAIIVWPKITAVFFPEVLTTVGYTEWNPGFLFFTDGANEVAWKTLKGLVITPLDTHLMASIVGLYFGNSIVNNVR